MAALIGALAALYSVLPALYSAARATTSAAFINSGNQKALVQNSDFQLQREYLVFVVFIASPIRLASTLSRQIRCRELFVSCR